MYRCGNPRRFSFYFNDTNLQPSTLFFPSHCNYYNIISQNYVNYFFGSASHVRRVRVPSQASDVDQFLDDLFNPVLDQLSDARSLAASIKGSSKSKSVEDCESLDSRDFAKRIKGGGSGGDGRSIESSRASRSNESPSQDGHLEPSLDISTFTRTVKGGGRGVASQQQVFIYTWYSMIY